MLRDELPLLFPQLGRIFAPANQFQDFLLRHGFVFTVSDAKPRGITGQHFCRNPFSQNIVIDEQRYEIFRFQFIPLFPEEVRKTFFEVLEDVGFQAPEIHGYQRVFLQGETAFGLIKEYSVRVFLDFCPLDDAGQVTVFIGNADSPGYGTMFRRVLSTR